MGGGGGCPGTRVRVGVPPADGLGREDGVRRGRPHRVCEGWRGGGGLCPASRGGGRRGGGRLASAGPSGAGGRPARGGAPPAVTGRRRRGPRAAAGPVGGTRRLGVDVGALARGACRAPRPPHPFQVPSASRRGGLKTPGGGGVARPPWGSGRSGPRGVVGSCLPSPPRPRRPPRGRGGARRGAPRSLPPRPSGGGYPTAVVWAVAVCGGACARCPASLGEGWGPPGRLWGCPSPPWRLGAGRPVVWNLSRPLRSAVFCLTWPARGNPLPQLPPPGREAGVGGMCRARGGCPAETKPLKTSYDS